MLENISVWIVGKQPKNKYLYYQDLKVSFKLTGKIAFH